MSGRPIDSFDQATIDAYQAAYVAANGKEAPAIIYRGRGWFELNGRCYRRGKINDFRDMLQSRAIRPDQSLAAQGEKS
jgi:hypothetical protein